MSNIKDETVFHADTTSPAAPTTEPVTSSRGPVLAILFGVGMLVLGLVGGWMLARDGDDPGTWGAEIDDATLTEIDELLADYWAGWDAGDGDAVIALMTAEGWFSSNNTADSGQTGRQLADHIDRYGYLVYTQTGPTTVITTRAGYEVIGAARIDEYSPEPLWTLDQFVIVEEAGQLRIASHRVISTV